MRRAVEIDMGVSRLAFRKMMVHQGPQKWQEKRRQRRDRQQVMARELKKTLVPVAKHHSHHIRQQSAARPSYGSVGHCLFAGSRMFGKPIRITDGVYQIRAIGARVTVLSEGNDLMLLDAGLRGSSRAIAQGLGDLGQSPQQISGVVITHAHPDHSGGLAELVAGKAIPVAAHSSEADIIEGTTVAPNPLRWKVVGPVSWSILNKLMGRPVQVDHRLEDGETLSFPSRVRVIHLPGHTPGSIGLYLPEKRTVVVGDALQYKLGRKLYPPAPGVTQCPGEALRSLEKLLDLDFDIISFSHFPPMRNEPRKALEALLKRHIN